MVNRLREALSTGTFAITLEIVPPERRVPLAEALAAPLVCAHAIADDPRIAALSVTDRVRSDDDHDVIDVAIELGRASGLMPVVHLSGKDRDGARVLSSLARLAEAGLENVLCITGDRLKSPVGDRTVPYVDSVDAIQLARRSLPQALIAAAVSPFKYTEEERLNQYFKMTKKHAAGVDYDITQIGWDMEKLDELLRYRHDRGIAGPVLANFMALSAGGARYIHRRAVPGVVVTDDLVALAEHEAQAADKGRGARLDRLALQMVGAARLGYAGVHLSGLSTADDARRVLDRADEWSTKLVTVEEWWSAWDAHTRLPSGEPARLGPTRRDGPSDARSQASVRLRPGQWWRYRLLEAIHDTAFQPGSPFHQILRGLARPIDPGSRFAATLARLEGWIKTPLVGCRLCGDCRLPETFYVCPETCPKGLANGPCGGSTDNLCEAGDRQCIHSLIYRLAKATGRLDELETMLIPPVAALGGSCSWLRHFQASSDRSRTTPG
jgi:methylenetetrahydrofolate reductase (NADH)